MEKTTFKDSGVIDYLNKYFVSVRVDTMKEKKLAASFRVRSLPASWFLSEKGEAVGYAPGYFPPGDFMEKLKYIRNERYNK
jgi:thioredoxin-related protein